jgi:methylated-DNA-[protein]-cysteine S-methyltransferase
LFPSAQITILKSVKTEKIYRYTIFKTKLGWFGLLSGSTGLIRSCLPVEDKEAVQRHLLKGIEGAVFDKKPFFSVEKAVKAYYEGNKVDFSDIQVDLEVFTPFQRHVLAALRNVSYGNTITYGQLAKLAGSPKAARAIGGVMAKNPLPLIIPCHRVIGSNGSPTGFSAPGGIQTKLHMINLEKA